MTTTPTPLPTSQSQTRVSGGSSSTHSVMFAKFMEEAHALETAWNKLVTGAGLREAFLEIAKNTQAGVLCKHVAKKPHSELAQFICANFPVEWMLSFRPLKSEANDPWKNHIPVIFTTQKFTGAILKESYHKIEQLAERVGINVSDITATGRSFESFGVYLGQSCDEVLQLLHDAQREMPYSHFTGHHFNIVSDRVSLTWTSIANHHTDLAIELISGIDNSNSVCLERDSGLRVQPYGRTLTDEFWIDPGGIPCIYILCGAQMWGMFDLAIKNKEFEIAKYIWMHHSKSIDITRTLIRHHHSVESINFLLSLDDVSFDSFNHRLIMFHWAYGVYKHLLPKFCPNDPWMWYSVSQAFRYGQYSDTRNWIREHMPPTPVYPPVNPNGNGWRNPFVF